MKVAAQVHRYGGAVAVYIRSEDAGTAYLSPANARQYAAALVAASDSIEAEPSFAKSTFKTVEFEFASAKGK